MIWRNPWVKIAVSAALLGLLLWYVDAVERIGTLFASAAPAWLLAAFLVITADRLLMSYKWLGLLESRGLHLPLFHGFKIYCAAMTWGMFLPTTVGADALRGYLAVRSGPDSYEVFASIVVERVVGFVAALLVGVAALVILSRAVPVDERFDPVWWTSGAVLLCAIAAVLSSFSAPLFETLLRVLPRRLRESGMLRRLRHFHDVYSGYGLNRRALAVFFVLTVAEQLFMILGPWAIARALYVDVSLPLMIAVVPLALMIGRLPVSFDGIGVFEGVFVLLMGLVGVGAAEALAVALGGRLVQVLALAPWWLLYSAQTRRLKPGPDLQEPVSTRRPSSERGTASSLR